MNIFHRQGFLAFLSVLTLAVTFPVLPLYLEALGYTAAAIGLIVGIMNLSLAASELASGYISDRMGRRATLFWGYVGSAASMIWFALSRSSPGIYTSRIFQGVFRGFIWPPLFAEVADAAPVHARGRAFGLFWFYFSIGILLGPLLGGAVADRYGLVVPFFLGAVLAFLALPLILGIRPEPKKTPEEPGFTLVTLWEKTPVVYLLSGATLMYTVMTAIWNTYIPLHAARQGLGPSEIGFLFTLNGLAFALIQVPAARFADRVPIKLLSGVGILTRAGLIAATPLAVNLPSLSLITLLYGMAGGFVPLTISAWIAQIIPRQGAVAAMGVYNASIDAGFFIGPAVGGLVAMATSLPFVFALCAAVGFIGLVFLAKANGYEREQEGNQ